MFSPFNQTDAKGRTMWGGGGGVSWKAVSGGFKAAQAFMVINLG